MPRKRDPRRDKARNEWIKRKGDMKLVDLAKQFEVSSSTIRKWKAQDKWENELKGNAPITKKSAPKRKGGQIGNQNAKGHGAPVGNANSVSHGLFAKYLPDETREIADQVEALSPLDILWMNIKMQFASIMRAQQIMFVSDRHDMTKEVKKLKESAESDETEYEIQFAWDKQVSFLNSQSRAMGELRSMLKQFAELSTYDDDRKLEAERMQATIDKTKADTERAEVELEKAKQDDSDNPIEIMIRKKGDGDD